MTQAIECPEARVSLGVYVLGAIDPADRALERPRSGKTWPMRRLSGRSMPNTAALCSGTPCT